MKSPWRVGPGRLDQKGACRCARKDRIHLPILQPDSVLTAYENVEFALAMQGTYSPQELRKRVIDILDAVGQRDYTTASPRTSPRTTTASRHCPGTGQGAQVDSRRRAHRQPRFTNGKVHHPADAANESGENVTFIFSTHDPMVMEHARRLITVKDGRIEADERR